MSVSSCVRAAGSVAKLFLSALTAALCCSSAVILHWASKCQWQNESWALVYTLQPLGLGQDSWGASRFPYFLLSEHHRYCFHVQNSLKEVEAPKHLW